MPSDPPPSSAAPGSARLGTSLPPLSGQMRRAAMAFAVVLSAMAIGGSALSPYLLVEHPLWLVALAPDWRHFALIAATEDYLPTVAIGAPRRLLGMIATYGIGAAYGTSAMAYTEVRYPRVHRFVRFFERIYLRVGAAALAFIPTYTVAGLAGVARTRLWVFCVASFVGQIGYVSVSYVFGESIERYTTMLIAWLQGHLVESTVVVATLVLVQQLLSLRKRRAQLREATSTAPDSSDGVS